MERLSLRGAARSSYLEVFWKEEAEILSTHFVEVMGSWLEQSGSGKAVTEIQPSGRRVTLAAVWPARDHTDGGRMGAHTGSPDPVPER